jgi:hypothetical protein
MPGAACSTKRINSDFWIFTGAPTPRDVGLIMEETFFGWAWSVTSWAVVSASYDRFFTGAGVPVQELGPKILG